MKKHEIRTIINKILYPNHETRKLISLFRELSLTSDHQVLDVGCGYGEKMKLLNSLGINIEGVEVNEEIVSRVRAAGLACLSIDDFQALEKQYDVVLMSHIIEHFSPKDLLVFLDEYLARLKTNGVLIILTPLLSPYFYDDFDHIKPYHPTGINMVFCDSTAQVQYYSRNRMQLIDLWFRRSPFRLNFCPGLYLSRYSKLPLALNIIFAILFRISFGVIGITDGWIGMYKKISQ
jgi:SAM-dependent methyltransferase